MQISASIKRKEYIRFFKPQSGVRLLSEIDSGLRVVNRPEMNTPFPASRFLSYHSIFQRLFGSIL